MNREELSRSLRAFRPENGEIVYVERRGDAYAARLGAPAEIAADGVLPDAWIFYAGPWPLGDDAAGWAAFFDDLLAEMDSMANGEDRCRWAIDDPWPRRH